MMRAQRNAFRLRPIFRPAPPAVYFVEEGEKG
jgi:hypothetical protein